jgi:hypothetical protein
MNVCALIFGQIVGLAAFAIVSLKSPAGFFYVITWKNLTGDFEVAKEFLVKKESQLTL